MLDVPCACCELEACDAFLSVVDPLACAVFPLEDDPVPADAFPPEAVPEEVVPEDAPRDDPVLDDPVAPDALPLADEPLVRFVLCLLAIADSSALSSLVGSCPTRIVPASEVPRWLGGTHLSAVVRAEEQTD